MAGAYYAGSPASSSIGAGFMAKKIGDYILRLFSESALKEVTFSNVVANFNFHGFQEVDFNLGDVSCKVVRPKVAADGLLGY